MLDKVIQTTVSALDFTKCRMEYLEVPFSDSQGIPIGQGSAKAVILRVPARKPNTDTAVTPNYIYFGDSQAQQHELAKGTDSPLIMVTDIQQIFVRCPTVYVAGDPIVLGVIIYE